VPKIYSYARSNDLETICWIYYNSRSLLWSSLPDICSFFNTDEAYSCCNNDFIESCSRSS